MILCELSLMAIAVMGIIVGAVLVYAIIVACAEGPDSPRRPGAE